MLWPIFLISSSARCSKTELVASGPRYRSNIAALSEPFIITPCGNLLCLVKPVLEYLGCLVRVLFDDCQQFPLGLVFQALLRQLAMDTAIKLFEVLSFRFQRFKVVIPVPY